MKKIILVAVVVAFVAVSAMAQARPQPAGSPAVPSLDERIKTEIGDFKGKVWIYAKNLDTGKEYGMRADEQVRTASTIKLPIMTEVFRQVAEGKIAWTDPIEITKAVKVGGSGILFEFTDGTKIDVKTAMTLMIVQSDNTATNVILDKVSSNSVNDFMAKLGLNDTLSLRKIGGGGDAKAWDEPVNKLFGIGRSSPRDMVRLLEMLEKGEVVSKEASAEMIAILRRQQYKDGIGRNALDTVPVASKSGSLDRLRSDVGIVYTRRGRIAMAITVDDMPVVQYIMDDMGNELIWRLSQILQEGLAR
ncbi:MAG: serine hydrolase [Acidobacteria bacterium]|nr:serine hydrolase [Acidobacteriota bacterium]